MTGPEHYREAENLMRHLSPESGHQPENMLLLAAAQVHATLALAAAAALVMGETGNTPLRAYDAWQEAAGENGGRS